MNIITGTDFSPGSRNSVEVAAAMARKAGVTLRLVHAFDEAAANKIFPAAVEVMRAAVHEKLEAIATALRQRGTIVDAEVVFARAEEALLRDATPESVIVLGAYGWQSPARFNLGSVAESLAVTSTSSLIIVRDPDPLLRWLNGERGLHAIVAIDSSATSAAAVKWLNVLRKFGACDVSAAHVAWPSSSAEEREIVREFEENLARLGETDVAVEVVLNSSRPADALTYLAMRRHADLVIVGTHQRGGAARWRGSIPYALLQLGTTAVTCVPADPALTIEEPPELRRILVPTDLSEFGNRAVSYAFSIAHGGEVRLLHIVDPNPVVGFEPLTEVPVTITPEQIAEMKREAEDRLRASVPEWTDSRVTYAVVESSNVSEAIIDEAKNFKADVICLTSHGRAGMAKWLYGSVAEDLVQKVHQPVLVVRD